jgi:hypothetical protein
MLAAHGFEERVVESVGFPRLHRVLVEAQEDPFASVLDDGDPTRLPLGLERGDASEVLGFAGADPGEAAQCCDDTQAVSERHPGELAGERRWRRDRFGFEVRGRVASRTLRERCPLGSSHVGTGCRGSTGASSLDRCPNLVGVFPGERGREHTV